LAGTPPARPPSQPAPLAAARGGPASRAPDAPGGRAARSRGVARTGTSRADRGAARGHRQSAFARTAGAQSADDGADAPGGTAVPLEPGPSSTLDLDRVGPFPTTAQSLLLVAAMAAFAALAARVRRRL
jgi:hypothetical protein